MSDTNMNPSYINLISAIQDAQLSETLSYDEPLRKYTTWRVGGPADLFIEAKSAETIQKLVRLAVAHSVPYFILGGGSNVLIGDKGFRGLVIKNGYSEIAIIGDRTGTEDQQKVYEELHARWQDHVTGVFRHTAVHFHYYSDETDPNYEAEQIFLRISSGYSMASLIREMLDKGITGMEKFTRIPGTLGGWIYNNTHGHTQFMGDFILEVRSMTPEGDIVTREWNELDFGYDQSIFHDNHEVILDATVRFFKGNADAARKIAVDVMKNKLLRQPSNSGGCVFHNVTAEEKERNQFESDAVGYIVDKKLQWLGTNKVGGAWISSKHGNFIETDGTATAQDILAVMDAIRKECKKQYNVELREEIFRVGEF